MGKWGRGAVVRCKERNVGSLVPIRKNVLVAHSLGKATSHPGICLLPSHEYAWMPPLPQLHLLPPAICLSCLLLSPLISSITSYHPPTRTNPLTMTSSSDVSSSMYSSSATQETDLSLCLSLSSSANMGMDSGKGCSRVSCNEPLGFAPSCGEMGNGGWFKGRMKRVNGEPSIGGEDERKRRVLNSLQLCEEGSTHSSPAVGWPPLQTCRKNAHVYIQQRSPQPHHEHVEETTSGNSVECKRGSNFVKVVMDGMPIGRKVDLNAHHSYTSLALTLEIMFQLPLTPILKDEHSSSTHCASDYLLTYVDKDGDWMLLGDAPWENFVKSVKRLRISHSAINGASSELVGAKDAKKMHYITRHFVDFVNAQRH